MYIRYKGKIYKAVDESGAEMGRKWVTNLKAEKFLEEEK